MANYSNIKRVEPPWSCIAMAVEENWNLEEQEDIGEVERETEKLRREAAERLDKDNAERVQKGIAHWDKQNNDVPAPNCMLKV